MKKRLYSIIKTKNNQTIILIYPDTKISNEQTTSIMPNTIFNKIKRRIEVFFLSINF